MKEYDFKTIENKWQKIWEDAKYGEAVDFSDKPKHYHLVEFPYPSGTGLHVGHCMGYGASDAYSRMKRMQGYNVMYPMGWDAFGLPTENYAIKTKQKPQDVTSQNVEIFKKQIKSLGYSFDFNREVNTTDPNYYKWTQWIFLQFYKHAVVDGKLIEVADSDTTTPRLAFQAEMPVNWCPSCKIVLANEEVVNNACERCGTDSEKRVQKQWMLRITAYADKLIKGLDSVNYLDKIRTQQINWIGKSEGAEIKFPVSNSQFSISVFTTRADTLFGCTYVVISPESKILENLKPLTSNLTEIENYILNAKKKSDLERTELQKDKTGVKLVDVKAINPINNEEVDIYVADYVLASYGTGAVMAVPAHDDRDFEFAKKYGIEIKEVIIPKVVDKHDPPKDGVETIFRHAIQGILIDPKTDKVLTLKWKKFPWTTFITGGIEGDENVIDAAKREITEETGYKNIKFVRNLGGIVESHFFAAHKNVNRKAHFSGMVFELENDEQDELSEEENSIHSLVWQSWDELDKDKNIKCAEYEIWVNRFHNSEQAFTDYGVLINSEEFDGLTSAEAKKAITQKLKNADSGDFTTNFKLRDWIFSRQHYWGEPIPIIHCDKCGKVPVSETDLPLTLPAVENYEPTDNGESPLSAMTDWVNTTCPTCSGPAKRETDTMPNWAGSSWYYLRYCDPKNDQIFVSPSYRREEIKPTEKDLAYIEEFKKIYTDLDTKGIKTWATNRFLLNGLNHSLWLPLRTISVMVFEKDIPLVEKYILEKGYKEEKVYKYGKLYLNGEIRFEYVTVFIKDGIYSSISEKGALQVMKKEDLPESVYGYLNDFNYRVVSLEYNLNHYKFINEFEKDTRTGLGDDEKIKFLEEYVQTTNKKLEYWMNVDIYNGGMEHNNLHLLYSRFWHLFLYDLGVVTTPEPYAKRIAHGIILGPDGQKMSKSKGNVINPDSIVEQFGADTLRAYIMFIGPYDQESAWNNAGIMGVQRFLKRVWQNASLVTDKPDTDELLVKINQTIYGVTEDLEAFRMNTVISKLMEMNNMIEKVGRISKTSYKSFLKLLSVSCPFISEELWEKASLKGLVSASSWPKADKEYLIASKITMAIQINGKLRDTIEIESGATEKEIVEMAQNTNKIKPLLLGLTIKKTIFVPKRLVNFVI